MISGLPYVCLRREFIFTSFVYFCMGDDMDWSHEQQRRELKEAMARHESAQSVNLVYEMERDFKRIFGGAKDTDSSYRRVSDGDAVQVPSMSRKSCKIA